MDREDIQHLVEEVVSLRLQSAEYSDRDMFGEARGQDEKADALETQLNDAGYTLEDDKDDIELIHVLAADGTRYASFDLANWQWIEST